jgi:serine/threonine protein kinase
MSVDKAAEPEDPFAAVLAACDEMLAGGSEPAIAGGPVAPEMRTRLEQDVSCLRLLERVWPRQLDNRTLDLPPSGEITLSRGALHPALDDTLGDFRLVREIGRGGMGVVYEAQQISLGRRVAVKVLPLAGVPDAKQSQRFRNEAQAAAHLHHPHIVPVHAVGCERGVHYFAMQFIEGQTLAALIGAMRQNARPEQPFLAGLNPNRPEFFRAVAELGIQAALALEHAHQMGVIHRDVKPANLMLDFAGKLWVTDFGLARFDRGAGLTESGDWLGTLRYMSPEQALSKHGLVDQRTDVYSLGATLYELATLEPVFPSDDRQQVIRQIALAEPRPLQKIRPDVPFDLQTVVLKALEKSPGERYGSAQELAEDLRRYLHDEPIRAKPPTPWQYVRKWLRRHRVGATSAAAASVLILILAVIGLAIGNRFIAAERARAIANLQIADENFQIACDAVDRMLTRVSEERLRQEPGTVQSRRRLLEDTRDFCLGLIQQRGADGRVRHQASRAYDRLGIVHRMLGEPAESREAHQRAIEILEELVREFPEDPQNRSELADAHLGVAAASGLLGNRVDQERACRGFLAVIEPLAAEFPGQPAYRTQLVRGQVHLAYLNVSNRRYLQAIQIATETLDRAKELTIALPHDLEPRLWYAHCQHILATALRWIGRPAEAEEPERQAVTLLRERAASLNNEPESRNALATALAELGEILAALGKFADAERALQEALQLEQQLTVAFPEVHEYQSILESSLHPLIGLLLSRGRAQEAENAYRHLLKVYAELATQFPGEPGYRLGMASLQQDLFNLLFVRNGRHDKDGIAALGEAQHILQDLVTQNPRSALYKAKLFRCLAQQAALQTSRESGAGRPWFPKKVGSAGNTTDPAQTYARALGLLAAPTPGFPSSWLNPVEISGVFCNYAIYLKNQGRLQEALAVLRRGEENGAFAFVTQSGLMVDEMLAGGRYPIACALVAVAAGSTRANAIDDKEQVRWRHLALQSLHADLGHWSKVIQGAVVSDPVKARERLENWQRSPDLAAVRGSAIDRLPAQEQEAWRSLWANVQQTLAKAPRP